MQLPTRIVHTDSGIDPLRTKGPTMIRKLIVTVVAALAITGCQNELALFPHAAGAPSPAPDPAPDSVRAMISQTAADIIAGMRAMLGDTTVDAITNSTLKLYDEAFGDGVNMALKIIDIRIGITTNITELRSLQQVKADIVAAHTLLKDTINRED